MVSVDKGWRNLNPTWQGFGGDGITEHQAVHNWLSGGNSHMMYPDSCRGGVGT